MYIQNKIKYKMKDSDSDAHIPHSSQHANRISPETPLEGWNNLNFLPCRSQLLIPFPTQDPVAHSLAQAFIPWQPGTQCPSLHRAALLPQGTNQQWPPPQRYRHTALNLTQDTTTFTFTRSTRGTAATAHRHHLHEFHGALWGINDCSVVEGTAQLDQCSTFSLTVQGVQLWNKWEAMAFGFIYIKPDTLTPSFTDKA